MVEIVSKRMRGGWYDKCDCETNAVDTREADADAAGLGF
jgi:hypothetical protein